jgi:hypothetical protein
VSDGCAGDSSPFFWTDFPSLPLLSDCFSFLASSLETVENGHQLKMKGSQESPPALTTSMGQLPVITCCLVCWPSGGLWLDNLIELLKK